MNYRKLQLLVCLYFDSTDLPFPQSMDIPWTLPRFRYLLIIMLMQCLLHAIVIDCFPYCRISPTLLSPRPPSLATCQIIVIPSSLNILVTRNRKSVNLRIRVPVLGNHLFVLDYSFYFYGNICQVLAASAVRSGLYKYPCRNYDSVCTKVNLKSDFHIAGQLMETHQEYSFTKC